jgi:MurNAc alpha-1-phosphate uridylyltransferase
MLLETGGGLVHALPQIDADPFLVVNSDNLWVDGPIDSLRLLASHWDDERMDALLLLVPLARAYCHKGRGDFHMDAAASCGAASRRASRRSFSRAFR